MYENHTTEDARIVLKKIVERARAGDFRDPQGVVDWRLFTTAFDAEMSNQALCRDAGEHEARVRGGRR